FPCNRILSHDLIEGEYARTALLSDVVVIDDYPSHVGAYSRRRHRWARGDWQIIYWLMPRVRDYFGMIVPNPLRTISRWKIADNLRRSLTEASIFVFLLCSWIVLPGNAFHWTLGILAVLSFPTACQVLLSLLRAGRAHFASSIRKHIVPEILQAYAALLLRLSLLCHQALVMLDAVGRTVIRMTVTQKRLLQWETAAQAEPVAAGREAK